MRDVVSGDPQRIANSVDRERSCAPEIILIKDRKKQTQQFGYSPVAYDRSLAHCNWIAMQHGPAVRMVHVAAWRNIN